MNSATNFEGIANITSCVCRSRKGIKPLSLNWRHVYFFVFVLVTNEHICYNQAIHVLAEKPTAIISNTLIKAILVLTSVFIFVMLVSISASI